jgi:hypothetical protein
LGPLPPPNPAKSLWKLNSPITRKAKINRTIVRIHPLPSLSQYLYTYTECPRMIRQME